MGCACEVKYGFPCQFQDETEFHAFDGKHWCLFHLPLEDAEGNKSPKDSWQREGADWQRFEDEVFDRLRNPIDTSLRPLVAHWISDLRAVVFPHNFDFVPLADTTLYPDFSHAAFGVQVIFDGARFGDQAHFGDAAFGVLAIFDRATFGDWAIFDRATFGDWARFNGATFGDWACFNGAKFGDGAYFNRATFAGFAEFQGEGGGSEEARDLFRKINFDGAEFHGPAVFRNRKFVSQTSFRQAIFHDIPDFHGCTLHQDTSFHQTKFLKTKGKRKEKGKDEAKENIDKETANLERAYRTLKLAMENHRARNDEADFYALELECRRQRGDVPWFERLFATLYKEISDYGRSIGRPPLWMGITLLWGAIFYGLVAIVSGAMFACEPEALAVEITETVFGQIVKPFKIWDIGHHPQGAGYCLYDQAPWAVATIASFQTIVMIGLLAVFLLAVRRRFKMD